MVVRRKFLYVTHLSGRRVNRFWLSAFEAARSLGYEVHLACNMTDADPVKWDADCERYGLVTHQIDFDRRPLAATNLKAYRQLRSLIQKEEFEIIHSNTPVGGAISRLASRNGLVNRVIYEAHGFHFWKGAPIVNWAIYYPIEKLLSHYCDTLITINDEDYRLACKRFKSTNTTLVHGVGVDLDSFRICGNKSKVRNMLGIEEGTFVLLSVGELNRNKNHEIVIRALGGVESKSYVYLIAGEGDQRSHLTDLATKLNVNLQLLGFREDVDFLYKAADAYVMPSFREGLPVSLMEAMASGLPCVVSDVRGNRDLVNEYGGLACDPDDPKCFSEAIAVLANDMELRKAMGKHNMKVAEDYSYVRVVSELRRVYES